MAATTVPQIAISWEINITTIIAGLVVVIGYIGSILSMKIKVDNSQKDIDEAKDKVEVLEERHQALSKSVSEFQIQIADRYVKKDDLRETEARITERISAIEHEVRQIPMKILGLMRGQNPV